MHKGYLIYDRGGRVQRAMDEVGMTLSDFSELSGVCVATLRQMLRGDTPLDLRVVLASSVHLDLPVRSFLGGVRFYETSTSKGKKIAAAGVTQ